MSIKKKSVALLYGGQSAEHEVSVLSAKNVFEAIDKEKFTATLVYIDPSGTWYLQKTIGDNRQNIPIYLPMNGSGTIIPVGFSPIFIDAALPILHGPYGEDGTMQGLLELLKIPYVGPGVLASAVCMDKDVMKRLLRDGGAAVAPYHAIKLSERAGIDPTKIIKELGQTLFVKPANMGSSVGVSRATSVAELMAAIDHAFTFDTKILIESEIKGDEIECAVLGNNEPKASTIGKIIPKRDGFYSYEAKYTDETGAELELPANIAPESITLAQKTALSAYKILECEGMARVDMFLTRDGKVIINELNTIPGFTNISMYPKLWEISGLSYTDLITHLIELALKRAETKRKLSTRH